MEELTKVYRVRLLPRAQDDIEETVIWLELSSSDGAIRWLQFLNEALDRIASNPLSFGLAAEAEPLGWEIREKLFKTPRGRVYRVLYLISENEVVVV